MGRVLVKQRGIALFVIIPIIIVLGLLGAILLKVATHEYSQAHQDYFREIALYTAESAIQEAILVTQYMANKPTSKNGLLNDFLGGGFSWDMTDLLEDTSALADEFKGVSIDKVTIEYTDVHRFPVPQMEDEVPGTDWYYYPSIASNAVIENPAGVEHPAYLADVSTSRIQGPPQDFYGTLIITAKVSCRGKTRHIRVTKDVKAINMTPMANEYSLYVRQGPFGTQPEKNDQKINEFNQGGEFTVYSGKPIRDSKGNPTERRIHIKGDYVINLNGDYYKYYENPDDPNAPHDPKQRYLTDPGDNSSEHAPPHGKDIPAFNPELENPDEGPCFGRSPIPYPRCVYHRGTGLIGGKTLHLLPKAKITKYFQLSLNKICNQRVFNSGVGGLKYKHRTSLFGKNVEDETGIEGQIWGRYKQYRVKGWSAGLGIEIVSHLELEGGTETEMGKSGQPTEDYTTIFPYKCVQTTKGEQFHWWDVLSGWFRNFVSLGPLGYYLTGALGFGDFENTAEAKKLLEQYKIVDMPDIIGGPPGGPDGLWVEEPYFGNAKLRSEGDDSWTLDYLPFAVRHVDKFTNLLSDGKGLALDGIISCDEINVVPSQGSTDIRYKYRGGLYTTGPSKLFCSLKSVESENKGEDRLDLSYLLFIKKGKTFDKPGEVTVDEKIVFEHHPDLPGLVVDASLYSTNSMIIPKDKGVNIFGNLVCDRILKSKIEGQLHVTYDETVFDSHYIIDPADELFDTYYQYYVVTISPQISSWEDLMTKGQ